MPYYKCEAMKLNIEELLGEIEGCARVIKAWGKDLDYAARDAIVKELETVVAKIQDELCRTLGF